MSKKILLIFLCFSMVLSLAACGGTETQTPATDNNAQTEGSTESIFPADGVLVKDGRVEEGEYEDDYDNQWNYSYHLPQLQINTEAAQNINEDIASILGGVIDEQFAYMDEKTVLTCFNISWESYENYNILSLVISSDTLWDECNYLIFNYDLTEHCRLYKEDLVKAVGYNEGSFDMDVRKAAVREYDAGNASYFEEYFDPTTLERRAYTASNCYPGEDCYYIKDGQLHGIVTLGSMAGASTMLADVVIENEPETVEAAPMQCNCDFVWATLKENNDVYISFEDTEDAREFLDGGFVDIGNYKVEGCYQKYNGMYIGSISDEYFHPVLFLSTESGHVEYVDIYNFVNYGTLCCGNVLTGVKDVVSFMDAEAETDYGSYVTVFAQSSSGEKYNLGNAIYGMESDICYMYKGTGTADIGDELIYLELDEESDAISVSFGPKNDFITKTYTGYCMSMGMNENGQVIAYWVFDEEDVWYNGCFEIPAVYSDNFEYDNQYIYIHWISGDNIFNSTDILSFTRSVG